MGDEMGDSLRYEKCFQNFGQKIWKEKWMWETPSLADIKHTLKQTWCEIAV
jgi:hypothetical protein